MRWLSAGKKRFLNTLIWCKRNWGHTQASDGYFAKRVGVVRETILRYRHEFEDLNLIEQTGGHMQVCTISLSDFFDRPLIKKMLAPFLPAIMCFNLSLLSVQKRALCKGAKNVSLVKKKNVTPYKSLSFFFSLRSKQLLYLLEQGGLTPGSGKEKRVRRELVKVMLAKEQREHIQARKDHPKAREALLSPRIYDLIITPKIQKIAEKLELDERETLKCVAFPVVCLDKAMEIVMTTRDPRNPKKLFFSKAVEMAKTNKWKIEWGWYKDVCYILGIEAFDMKEQDVKKAPIDKDAQPHFEKSPIKIPQRGEPNPITRSTDPAKLDEKAQRFLKWLNNPKVEENVRKGFE